MIAELRMLYGMRVFAPATMSGAVMSLVLGCSVPPRIAAYPEAHSQKPFPVILPIDSLLARADDGTPDPGPALQARAAALQAKVAAIATKSTAP